MEFYAGHVEDRCAVHLTSRSFLVEALCGEVVTHHGEPVGATICAECHVLAVESGGVATDWTVVGETQVLRLAA